MFTLLTSSRELYVDLFLTHPITLRRYGGATHANELFIFSYPAKTMHVAEMSFVADGIHMADLYKLCMPSELYLITIIIYF